METDDPIDDDDVVCYKSIVIENGELVRYTIIGECDYFILVRDTDQLCEDIASFASVGLAINYFVAEFA